MKNYFILQEIEFGLMLEKEEEGEKVRVILQVDF